MGPAAACPQTQAARRLKGLKISLVLGRFMRVFSGFSLLLCHPRIAACAAVHGRCRRDLVLTVLHVGDCRHDRLAASGRERSAQLRNGLQFCKNWSTHI